MGMNTLKINGTTLSGIYVDAAVSFNKPAKRVTRQNIPGRNGALIIDEGTFDNVLISYPVFEKNTFPAEFDAIVNWLASLEGYQRIECSNDPGHFRLGRFVVPEAPTAKRLNKDGYYTLTFDCKPQRWLTSGEEDTEITANPSTEYTGNVATFTANALDEITGLTAEITPTQIGNGLDPSPTNVRAILGFDKAHILNSKFAVSASNGRLVIPWKDGNTNYNPEMNLCSVSDEELEGGTSVHGAFFEWDKVIPFGVPFDEPEAICYFDGTEGAGTFNIGIGMAYGTGWSTSKHIQFTLNVAPSNGDQLVINCGTNAANDPTNGRAWNLYAKGSTTSKDTGTTSNGTSGTNLGSTDSTDVGKTNGRVNAPQRIVYGYNRWSQSFLRQYLNATTESGWYAVANPWDRPDATVMAKAGFLYGYGAEVYNYFKPIKVVTVACNADNNVEDVTYDRVFLSSLEQMYVTPQFSGKEGSYWEYYKRLLGRTTPAAQDSTYPRLIKYALNAPTSAQYCWRRSANRYGANSAWVVNPSGYVSTYNAYHAYRCAPSVFISDEDIKITDITWQDTVGTVYGGTLDVTTGVLTITDVNIASYAGETLPSTWICDRAVYAEGVTPPTGSQVVYKLATPTTVQLTAEEVERLIGQNNIWADTGDVTVTITGATVFNNPSPFNAKPLIRAYGIGTFRINDNVVTIANHDKPYIDIDCELQECYYEGENMNAYVSFSGNDYPELVPGDNYVLMVGVTKLDVTPRWWIL